MGELIEKIKGKLKVVAIAIYIEGMPKDTLVQRIKIYFVSKYLKWIKWKLNR